jgi:hypothetical protein
MMLWILVHSDIPTLPQVIWFEQKRPKEAPSGPQRVDSNRLAPRVRVGALLATSAAIGRTAATKAKIDRFHAPTRKSRLPISPHNTQARYLSADERASNNIGSGIEY